MSYPPRPESEAALEIATLDKYRELGWETADTYQEFDHPGGSPLGRENKSQVLLTKRLKPALSSLNPDLPHEAIHNAIEELSRDRSRMSLAAANREVYRLLKEGINIEYMDKDSGYHKADKVKVIDWDNPENNDYLICSQFWITGDMYTRRADLVGFVNGIPLLFIELKASHRKLKTAYRNNLRDYRDTVPQIFWYNAFVILSNGSEARIGSTTASLEHFSEWKKVSSEKEIGVISLETVINGTCNPARFLDILENFCLFKEAPGGLIKILAKNHQYLGVNNALEALEEVGHRRGRLGVFWHTQGSGKSISMIFFSQKILRKITGNWTFVIVTDRKELDDQIYGNFETCGAVIESKCHAESSAHLRELLRGNHRYVFTLIHKFRTELGETHPVLSDRSDIIVITDEAHRSQYDTLALNMRTALPNASFLAFTGTPLIVGEEKTKDVFGEYVSVYDFKQSVEDGATVPLYYENRIPELQLTNENLNEDIERLLEEAELDDSQEKKLEREFSREYHLITREDRLDAVAEDIVTHFLARGYKGKAMVVCIDKATAIKMYDRVKENWDERIKMLYLALETSGEEERQNIKEELAFMEETDMAVVISQSQNEISDMREKGLDIRPHRKRLINEDLSTKFKDPEDSFRLVFVCAMWMTGFDAPSCSTIYLDKPMRNHTLMQTIARANRVFEDKVNGLIVDYVGVFRNLEKALSIYGVGLTSGAKQPVLEKKDLIEVLETSITDTREFCQKLDIHLDSILKLEGFALIAAMDDAVDSLVSSDETQSQFRNLSNDVIRFFKAILPDKSANKYAGICRLIRVLSRKIKNLSPEVETEGIDKQIEILLDGSISPDSYKIKAPPPEFSEPWVLNLSKVDFEALKQRFEEGRKHTETERLKRSIDRKLGEMIARNRTRMDYYDNFKRMIDDYNTGSASVVETYKKLLNLAKQLTEEEKRTITEGLSEEELAVFDLLTKPEIDMSEKERKRVKKASRHLLEVLKKEKLVLDWRKHQSTRAGVKVAIEKVLDEDLPEIYGKNLFSDKAERIFQHVYDSYYGAGKSVYGGIA